MGTHSFGKCAFRKGEVLACLKRAPRLYETLNSLYFTSNCLYAKTCCSLTDCWWRRWRWQWQNHRENKKTKAHHTVRGASIQKPMGKHRKHKAPTFSDKMIRTFDLGTILFESWFCSFGFPNGFEWLVLCSVVCFVVFWFPPMVFATATKVVVVALVVSCFLKQFPIGKQSKSRLQLPLLVYCSLIRLFTQRVLHSSCLSVSLSF